MIVSMNKTAYFLFRKLELGYHGLTRIPFINNTHVQDDFNPTRLPHSILYCLFFVTKGTQQSHQIALEICETMVISDRRVRGLLLILAWH